MLALVFLAALLQNTSALVEEGRKRMSEQAFAEAAALFEKAAEREPSSSRIHYYLGVSLMRLGRAEDAVPSLERAAALTPRANPAVAYELGTAYLQTGQLEDAERVLRRAKDRAPGETRIRLQLGWAYYQLVDGEKAQAEFRYVLEREPGNALAHFYLGMTEAALGKLEAAERSFREALELDKTLVGARLGLARVVSQSGRRDEAKSELQIILDSYPEGRVSAHSELGLITLREGNAETAARHFEAVLEADAGHRQATYNLSLLYRRLGRLGEAEAMRTRFESMKDDVIEDRSLSRASSKEPEP